MRGAAISKTYKQPRPFPQTLLLVQVMIRKLPSHLVNKKISRNRLLEAFNLLNLHGQKMEGGKDGASTANLPRTNFQSIEDFMKEQDELNAGKASNAAVQLAVNSTKKQKKAFLQAERDLVEAEKKQKKAAREAEKKSAEEQANEAVKELGVENWVGKLLGKSFLASHTCFLGRSE
jgi:hypothetical protein